MAVTTAGGTSFHWQGLSTDDKPTTDIQDGSTFHVIDTGEEYVYHDGMWEQDLRRIYAIQQAAL